MQKIGVKTLSIIDTLSELAQNENLQLAAQLSPPKLRPGPPAVPPPNPSPPTNFTNGGSGRFKFLTSSPKKSPNSTKNSSPMDSRRSSSTKKSANNLALAASAVATKLSLNHRGQTPDWIRDIFNILKKGNLEKLVS